MAQKKAGFIILLILPAFQAFAQIHPLSDIRETAYSYVQQQQLSQYSDTNISIGALDPRLRLPRCDAPLEAFSSLSAQLLRNGAVGVRCEGIKPWSIYVPVNIEIFREVAVANTPLARGQTITPNDFSMQRIEISGLSGSYLFEAKEIIGLELTRPVQTGKPLFKHILKAPIMVKRGQTVPLVAKGGTFEVRMEGLALSDAATGQRLKVRNKRSKRVVEGRLAENGTVFVN